ncbi:ArdC family protein [Anoxynatronum sibiricum]|uniref:ArdC family protein n=1 Tax=Anoxynatronum sibiricum TaxID=210623 RepID=A0ABU9VX63_9CLOT
MAKKSKEEIFKEASNKLLEMFQTGAIPQAVGFTLIRRQAGHLKPSDNWSIGNQVLMLAGGSFDARGFKQWQEAGRHVKKGAAAIHILAPLTKKIQDKTTQEEKTLIFGFRAIPVFRFEDTDGKPLPGQPDYTPDQLPPLYEVAAKLGITVKFAPLIGNRLGSYSSRNKSITLSAEDAAVYFHELSHAMHDRMAPLKGGQDPLQEIVAELSASVLCEIQGISGFQQQSYAYIKHYTAKMGHQDVLKAIMKVLSEVEQVVTGILELAAA